MSRTLYDHATHELARQRDKHDLGDDFVEREINALTNEEFLSMISDALEALQCEQFNLNDLVRRNQGDHG